jgi:hypothetical protein
MFASILIVANPSLWICCVGTPEGCFILSALALDRKHSANSLYVVAGSTGNVYQTTIGRSPRCVCMDAVSPVPPHYKCPTLGGRFKSIG